MSHLRRELGMFVALVVMCLVLWASNSIFAGQLNIVNTTRQIAMLGTFAIGAGFVIITGGIDLSVGSIIGLTGVIIAKVSSPELGCMGYSIWIGVAVAMAVALLIGLAQGLLITRLNLQPFIVTLGAMLLLRGVSETIVEGGTISFGGSSFRNLANNGWLVYNNFAMLSYPVLIFLGVMLVAAYVLHFTVFGRYVYAIGGNREAAEYSGINVKRVQTLTYVISAGLAGVAGICYASYIGQMSQQVGIAFELDGIAAAVIGGCSLLGGEGTVLGVMIGASFMSIIRNGIDMFRYHYHTADGHSWTWKPQDYWKNIIVGGVILIAVVMDQLVHLIQVKRRTRRGGDIPAHPASDKG